jgi:DNA gyrase subunit B
MKEDKKLYTKDSIESLSPLEFTRLKPGVYAGDTTYSTQLLVEIISNAVDEFRLGHGNKIDITIDNKEKDTTIEVRDFGQGFLVNEMRDDGKSVLEAAFSVLNTSGKYREDGTYEGTSLGSFGIGSKITTFLSHWLQVITYRDGKYEQVDFKEGVFENRKTGIQAGQSGTLVRWQPSEQFFTHTTIEESKIKSLLNTISCLCPGLTIVLKLDGVETTYYSEHGLNDLVDEAVKGKEIIVNRFNMKYAEGKEKLDMVLTYTSNYSLILVPYVNTGLTEKGPHITQVKTIITREFNKFFRDKKWLKDKEENLTGDDIQEGMYIVFNMTAPNVAYDAQVKSTVTKLDMSNFSNVIATNLQYWLTNNEKEVKVIFDKAAAARKAREAAKSARERVRENNKKKEKALKFDSKLADCYSKDRSKCEIYITEGDSASGNLKSARNNEFQAVMPVRGKILNTQKASLDKIQKNAEIMTMIDAFGLYIDTKTMQVTYDKNSLRYGKIIIESDADVDGAHIKNLFYTFIWNFCPQLIEDGYIYAGVPPLYKVTIGKEYKYIKNDEELEEFKKTIGDKKITVNRMKGLGEMSVDETEETLTDPNNRIIKQITVEDAAAADKLFNDLMGTAIVARKDFIKEHSKEATYNAE